jgi:hypothetical protein
MYERERERERERESCVFWRLFAFTQKEGKRKMSTVFSQSVKERRKTKNGKTTL